MKINKLKISEIKLNPNNPRLIKDDKFAKLVQSIKDFPEMLNIRPIVVNQDMIILGGNMRFKACKEAGLKEVPVIVADLTEEQQREFLIKDNVSSGEWDYNALLETWNIQLVNDWGINVDFPEEQSFEPILKPNTNYLDVTKEQIEEKAKEMAREMVKTQVLKEVMCPDCGCEFKIV